MPTNKLINKKYLHRQFYRYYNQIIRPNIVETDDNMIVLNAKLNRIIDALQNSGIPVDLSNIQPSDLFKEIYISGKNFVNVNENISLKSSETDVVWSSNDENIAMVDGNGVVYGISNGRTVITASKEGLKSGTKLIIVQDNNI